LPLIATGPRHGRYDPTDIKLTRQPAFKWGGGMDNSPPKFRPSINVPSPGPGESWPEKLTIVVGAERKKKGGGWEPVPVDPTPRPRPASAAAGASTALATTGTGCERGGKRRAPLIATDCH
jgi:hypothetical protein